jgi:O-antigen ligase
VPSGRAVRRTARVRGAAASSLIVGALAYAAISQGAYYGREQKVLLVPLVLASALVVRRPDRADVVAPVLGAAALAVWYLADAFLHGSAWGAWPAVGLLLSLAAVVVVVRRLDDAERRILTIGVGLVGAAVAVNGMWAVAVHHAPQALVDGGIWRAASTITYANATAALLAPLALVSLASLATAPRSWPRSLLAFVLLAGLATTASRGGLLAFAVGAVVLVVALGPRVVVASAPAVAGAVIAFAALVPSMPASSAARPGLALVGALAGASVAACAARPRWTLVAVIAVVVLAGVAVVVGGPVGRDFTTVRGSRLTLDSPDRTNETNAALRLARSHLVTGVGPGNYVLTWPAGDLVDTVDYAHDEYLQVFGESGAVGAAVVALGLAGTAFAVWSARSRVDRFVWAGTTAGLVAIAVHGSLDFVWHVPVVPLTGAVLAGLALGRKGSRSARASRHGRNIACPG